jgi:pimeloyl-[acyl-carrier protein] methyl ester esterase
MRAAYAQHPADVLGEFRASCGLPPCNTPRDDSRLRSGLACLADWDCRTSLARLQAPALCLAADDDPIVSSALTAATAAIAAAPCRVISTGGHVLPLTQPRWCAQQIRAFAAA